GERPFRGKQVMEIISSILFGAPQPPSLKREDLSPKIDAVAMRFLAKNQDERFATAKDAAEALRGLLQPVPSEVPELLDGMSFRPRASTRGPSTPRILATGSATRCS